MTPVMENQVEKNTEHEIGLYRLETWDFESLLGWERAGNLEPEK